MAYERHPFKGESALALFNYSLALDFEPGFIFAIIDGNTRSSKSDVTMVCMQNIIKDAADKGLYIDMTRNDIGLTCIIITSLGYVIGLSEHKDTIRNRIAAASGERTSVKKAVSSGKKSAGTSKANKGYEKK